MNEKEIKEIKQELEQKQTKLMNTLVELQVEYYEHFKLPDIYQAVLTDILKKFNTTQKELKRVNKRLALIRTTLKEQKHTAEADNYDKAAEAIIEICDQYIIRDNTAGLADYIDKAATKDIKKLLKELF